MKPRLDARDSILRQTGAPPGWTVRSVGDLADIVGGGTPNRDEPGYWRDGCVPWITPTDLTTNDSKYIVHGAESITELGLKRSNARLVPKGSIVFSTRGTVGKMAIAEAPLTCNQSCEILVPRAGETSGEFLYYLLGFGLSAFQRLSAGTTFLSITRRDLTRVRFAVPRDPVEQSGIAAILAAVDSAQMVVRQAIDAANVFKSTLCRDLMARGIAADGVLRGESPQDGSDRPAIGNLPSHWSASSVGQEFSLQNGLTLNEAERRYHKLHPYLRVANIRRDATDLTDVQQLGATDAELADRRLEECDLLVVEGHANRREIGRCALVPREAVGFTFQNHLFRLRSRGRLLPAFGGLWLNSDYAQRYWDARCGTSSGLNTINQRALRRLVVPVPPAYEQRAIANVAAAQRAHLDSLLSRQRALHDLKSTLARELLSGHVRLRELAGANAG